MLSHRALIFSLFLKLCNTKQTCICQCLSVSKQPYFSQPGKLFMVHNIVFDNIVVLSVTSPGLQPNIQMFNKGISDGTADIGTSFRYMFFFLSFSKPFLPLIFHFYCLLPAVSQMWSGRTVYPTGKQSRCHSKHCCSAFGWNGGIYPQATSYLEKEHIWQQCGVIPALNIMPNLLLAF